MSKMPIKSLISRENLMTDVHPVGLETETPSSISKKIIIDLSGQSLNYSIDDSLTLWEVLGAFEVISDSLKNTNLNQTNSLLVNINSKLESLLNSNVNSTSDSENKLLSNLLQEISTFANKK